MLGIGAIHKTLLQRLDALPPGHGLDVRTYKRNRSVVFVRLDQERFRVLENGYEVADSLVSRDGLGRCLKVLLRREFPRSNSVRVYDLGPFDPHVDARPTYKKI